MNGTRALIEVRGLTMAYGERVIQEKLDFTVNRGDIFFIMGGSGCGKSTLLKHMIGLYAPRRGDILFDGLNYFEADESARRELQRRWGVSYQSGALFSSMTLAENVALPIQQYTELPPRTVAELVEYKLGLVGLAAYLDYFPSQISGGMAKRAALARAIALDPEVLFFDEPSAGLDPLSSHLLDELIVQLSEALGATVVIVSHELASILSIGTNSVFLDTETRTMLDSGPPGALLRHSAHEKVRRFLSRAGQEISE